MDLKNLIKQKRAFSKLIKSNYKKCTADIILNSKKHKPFPLVPIRYEIKIFQYNKKRERERERGEQKGGEGKEREGKIGKEEWGENNWEGRKKLICSQMT